MGFPVERGGSNDYSLANSSSYEIPMVEPPVFRAVPDKTVGGVFWNAIARGFNRIIEILPQNPEEKHKNPESASSEDIETISEGNRQVSQIQQGLLEERLDDVMCRSFVSVARLPRGAAAAMASTIAEAGEAVSNLANLKLLCR